MSRVYRERVTASMVLTDQQRTQARQRLEEERERLRADRRALGAEIISLGQSQAVEGGTLGNHVADDATDILEQQTDIVLARQVDDKLRDIDIALQRLSEGTYGTCETCGKPINPARLEALPTARQCIDCRARDDRRNQNS